MGASLELDQLSEGDLLDYELKTWEVTSHTAYDDARWPEDEWRLESSGEARFLEYDSDDGGTFRLSRPAEIADVSVGGAPFLGAVREQDPPTTAAYKRDEYVLTEQDARIEPQTDSLTRSRTNNTLMGVCAGIAESLDQSPSLVRVAFVVAVLAPAGLPVESSCFLGPGAIGLYFLLAFSISKESPPSPCEDLSHYWVYEGDEGFLVFECTRSGEWSLYVGREVEPYEFDNLLPRSSD